MVPKTPSAARTPTEGDVAGAGHNWDGAVIEYARRYSVVVVRLALACVFIWFGALKLVGASPVADLVGKAVPFLPQGTVVLATGAVEVIVGVGLLTGLAPRLTLALFFALLLGTFSLLVTNPAIAFGDGNPLRLTTTGEFICKNIVLVSAGLVLVAAMPTRTERDELSRRLPPAWKAGRR